MQLSMSLRRVTAFAFFFIVATVSFAFGHRALAIAACQCSCVDTSATERLLTTTPATGQTYLQKCTADRICGDRTLTNAYAISITISGGQQERTACECTTPQVSTALVRQSAGDTACTGTCEASCRSQGLAVNTAITPTVVQTGCITDADCKTGIFKEFKDVACIPQTGTTGIVTNTCSIPITQDNANIECAKFGGTGMKGATCDFVAAGNIPSMYLITRPYLSLVNNTFAYQQRTYSSTAYPYAENLWTALDTDGGISNTPGICYLYGSQQADYSNMDVTKTLVSGSNGSKRYVCMKRKISACGTVTVNQTSIYPLVKNSIRYSCTPKSNVSAAQQTTNCLMSAGQYRSDSGAMVNGTDLCSAPGQICCALHCSIDAECGPYKICSSDGQCVAKTQCSSSHADWRCRTASAAEKANPSMCDTGLIKSLCQNPGQSCCAPVDPAAIGSCAADMQNNQDFRLQFGANGWTGFACLTTQDLQIQDQAIIADWKQGGSCIMSDVATTRSEAKSAARCGASKRCCLVSRVAPTVITKLDNRPMIGTPNCSATLPFQNSCINLSYQLGFGSGGLAQSTQPNGALMYDSMYSYGLAVIASGVCEATPVNPENPFNTQECGGTATENGVCCYSGLKTCDPDASQPCANASETCHPQLRICVPTSLLSKQLASESCAARAGAAGDESVEFIAGNNGVQSSDLTCQVVNASDSQVGTKCLVKGCTVPDGQTLSEGQEFRCCVPGTGQSPSASAANTGLGSTGESAAKSPSTIGLSSCISSGRCELDDILYSAANFANFLFKISGAVFLAIFVYAGFLYLTAGSSNRGGKGKEMIKQASIGLILLFSAYLLINFIQSSFISSSGTKQDVCGSTDETKNMTCQYLPVDASDEKGISTMVSDRKCVRNMCGGPKNRVCCPFGTTLK